MDNWISVIGARERNLKNVSIMIPKKQITVFTGVSGSGKSSLVFDTVAAESQRQLNETYSSFVRHRLPHYGQPDVDRIEHLPVSFVINQKQLGGNSRSTVGTVTDIYSLLRLLYSRIGKPFVGYSEIFSFNNPQGMCSRCGGAGKVDRIHADRILDKEKSLNQGAILFPGFEPNGWRITRYLYSGLFDNDKKLRDYSDEELRMLLYEDDYKLPNPDPAYPKAGIYEGVIPRIRRSILNEESKERVRNQKAISRMVTKTICPDCGGSRLNETIRSCKVSGLSIADCCRMQIDELLVFMKSLNDPIADTIIASLVQQLEQMVSIGLGYLSLNRDTTSLSGGESQRIKMVRQLGSSLSDVMYIFDEPSVGLHPYNVDRVNDLLRLLRDKGNTVLIVEHDPDIIRIADYVVDMGPKAGSCGGEVVFEGSYEGLMKAGTLTVRHLSHRITLKEKVRAAKGFLKIRHASLHNLKDISIDIPTGVLTVVTGVAGSGKSSLIGGELTELYPEAVSIDQRAPHASRRSNIATFTGIFERIRALFAAAGGVKASLFSFNSEGACPACKGLGQIFTDLAFMDPVASTCEVCAGKRYTEAALQHRLNGKDISEVLNMTVTAAREFFTDQPIAEVLQRLCDVGVEYITLGQSLDTLSGGELQRVKLAAELDRSGNLYILDEPTTGLHMSDIGLIMKVLNRIVDQGNTVIVIEHNLDVAAGADWIIDMGPGAGGAGGQIVFAGRPADLPDCPGSVTGKYLKMYLEEGYHE